MKTFILSIISDTKIVFSGPAVYCNVKTLNGEIGFEADHEPFFGVLAPESEISYKDSSDNIVSTILKSGIIIFENNSCTITVSL